MNPVTNSHTGSTRQQRNRSDECAIPAPYSQVSRWQTGTAAGDREKKKQKTAPEKSFVPSAEHKFWEMDVVFRLEVISGYRRPEPFLTEP